MTKYLRVETFIDIFTIYIYMCVPENILVFFLIRKKYIEKKISKSQKYFKKKF